MENRGKQDVLATLNRIGVDAEQAEEAGHGRTDPLAKQLAERGRLVQPLGVGGAEDVVLFEKRSGALRRVRSVSSARFVRLHGRYGFP